MPSAERSQLRAARTPVNRIRAYDDFRMPIGGDIQTIHWSGWFNTGTGTSIGFTVSIWTDTPTSGRLTQPGTLLFSEDFAGLCNQTPSAVQPSPYATYYDYSIDLTNPFEADLGVRYWLSVQADAGTQGEWFWQASLPSTGGNGEQVYDVDGQRVFNNADLTFALEGTPVPEPSSLILLGIGGVCWLLGRKKNTAPVPLR